MSFNNHLAFNVSKATPTTSTTNTNTTFTSSSPVKSSSSGTGSTKNDPNIPLMPNFLTSLSDSSPRIAAVSTTTSVSGVTPTPVSADSKEKNELINLLGKYDLDHEPSDDDDADLIEEKMRQFQVKSGEDENVLSEETTTEKESAKATSEGEASQSKSQADQSSQADQKLGQADLKNSALSMSIQPYIIPDTIPSENTVEESTETEPQDKTVEEAGSDQSEQTQDAPESPEEQQNESDLLTMDTTRSPEEVQETGTPAPDSSAPDTSAPVRPRQHRNNSIVRASETVNPKERLQQSHKPFDFQVFLTHLRKKSADHIVRYIRSFLVQFTKQAHAMTAAQTIQAIRQFKEFLNEKFTVYEPFASMDATDLENSGEGVEKLIMNRLYQYCFSPEAVKKFGHNASPSIFEDVREDQTLLLQLEKYSWILGVHLDVDLDDIAQRKHESSNQSLHHLDAAIEQLNKMNGYRAPRDKIICILNACKIIFNCLKVSNQETNADAFIPLLILVIIKAKTPNLMSNLHYIERYRGEEWLNHGETSYYLSSIQGAISFILNIRKEDLTITDKEYDGHMEAWEAELRQRKPQVTQPIPVQGRTSNTENVQGVARGTTMSPSEVIFASAEMFTKSISNLISPLPQEGTPTEQTNQPPQPQPEPAVSDELIDAAFGQLIEVFPTLDKSILRDIIIMNKANVEQSLDVCLALVNES